MNIAVPRTPAEQAYSLAGADIILPHRKLEDWRWTDLRRLIDRPYPPLTSLRRERPVPKALRRSRLGEPVEARLVLVNGRFDPSCSVMAASEGIEIVELSGDTPDWAAQLVPAGAEPLLAINQSFATGGVAIRIIAGTKVEKPIEVVHIALADEPFTLAARLLIKLEERSSATLVETHLSDGVGHISSSLTSATIGPGARLDRVKLQLEEQQAIHLANFHAELGQQAVLRDCTLTAGGGVTRQQGFITLAGERADASAHGVYLLKGKQHCDTRLLVDHKAAHCTSRELFKCVIDEQARGIFQGKVAVRRNAQKTDGKQSSHALLLSPSAEFDTKPELEIFADDVICGHGATVGDLDEDQLFYLRARGIPAARAKAMLIEAFVGEVFDHVSHPTVRRALRKRAAKWLKGLQVAA